MNETRTMLLGIMREMVQPPPCPPQPIRRPIHGAIYIHQQLVLLVQL